MSVSDPRDDASRPIGRPLRRSAVALAGSLLIVPLVALAIVPVYARSNPAPLGLSVLLLVPVRVGVCYGSLHLRCIPGGSASAA